MLAQHAPVRRLLPCAETAEPRPMAESPAPLTGDSPTAPDTTNTSRKKREQQTDIGIEVIHFKSETPNMLILQGPAVLAFSCPRLECICEEQANGLGKLHSVDIF